MSKAVKIPDMFLQTALKRKKSDLQAESTVKKSKSSEEEVEKENIVENTSQPIASKSMDKASATPTNLQSLLHCESWTKLLGEEFKKPYISKIEKFLDAENDKKKQVFPPRNEIFTAFNLIPFDDISVVVIGQDPYHNDDQAHGLSFSVKKGVKPPPSLKNIYKELESDIEGFKRPDHGFLTGWAKQGVFMLNATLTVRAHEANSHEKIGWQTFTDTVIRIISKESKQSVVFLLWGGFAHKKEALIDKDKHTAHPSPLSARKWFGCKCFSKCNEELENNGRTPIDWAKL